jgi:hypothetical protein
MAEVVGLPRDFTVVGAEGSRMREGATNSVRPSRIRVACVQRVC